MADSLTKKLLYVARETYIITANGALAVAPATASAIGFLNAPQGFVSGPEAIDAGLVGETADGIIIAFRGTLPPSSPNTGQMILDWATDCDALLVPDTGGVPGLVHQGFRDALDILWPEMEPVIAALSAASPNKPFYVTGHSKGGAVTYLAAMRLRTAYPAKFPVFVATFAAARAGNDLFAQAYDAAIPHSARFEYADDLVPHLPPSDAFIEMFKRVDFFAPTLNGLTPGYASVGDLHFIDWDGNLVGDSNLLEFHRFTHLAELMVGFGFQTIADDHSIAPGAGYDKGVP